jgi:hypothetical protein
MARGPAEVLVAVCGKFCTALVVGIYILAHLVSKSIRAFALSVDGLEGRRRTERCTVVFLEGRVKDQGCGVIDQY